MLRIFVAEPGAPGAESLQCGGAAFLHRVVVVHVADGEADSDKDGDEEYEAHHYDGGRALGGGGDHRLGRVQLV